jgi:hypothetical protein
MTHARIVAPAAFRRWVIWSTSIAVVGYAILAGIDFLQGGPRGVMSQPHLLMTVISFVAVLVVARVNVVVGAAITIAAVWIQMEAGVFLAVAFPSPGAMVLPHHVWRRRCPKRQHPAGPRFSWWKTTVARDGSSSGYCGTPDTTWSPPATAPKR